MVPSSSIAITTNGGGFLLGESVFLGNFYFIADYFSGLSLSPGRGNEGTVFVGSTRNGASTPQEPTIEDSTEEFLTTSSGEASLGTLPPDGAAQGVHLPPLQSQHERRMLQP
jgi:hypothetical protein